MFLVNCWGRHLEWRHRGSLHFFSFSVTGESHLEMLCEVVLPELRKRLLYDKTEIIWQQEGAPPHYSLRV
jgi:hypothetical protein